MAKTHVMTPARRAALKKAQAASAAKRRGRGRGKLAAANRQLTSYKSARRKAVYRAVGRAGVAVGVAVAAHYTGKYIARHTSSRRGVQHSVHGGGGATSRPSSARSGATRRVFVAHAGPIGRAQMAARKMTVKGTDHGHAKAKAKAKDPNARRMRIHTKVGNLGHYNSGLSHRGGRTIVASRHGAIGRR